MKKSFEIFGSVMGITGIAAVVASLIIACTDNSLERETSYSYLFGGIHSNKDIKPLATNAETGQPISSEVNGFWLPPEDFLTEEEKEFRNKVIEAAGLDKNDPNFEEQLAKFYTASDPSEYPNDETYILFHENRLNSDVGELVSR